MVVPTTASTRRQTTRPADFASTIPRHTTRTSTHYTGSGITIERIQPRKQGSCSTSKGRKNQPQALQEENVVLMAENAKLREEIKQLEALNAVLQSENYDSSVSSGHPCSLEYAQRRLRLVQAQNVQLQRQVSLLQDAINARENAESNLMSALNHWRNVIDAGREEAFAASADRDAAMAPTEVEETGARESIKWMLAVPDKLMNELKRVEGQIRSAASATNACFETKLFVGNLAASFMRNGDPIQKLSDVYGRNPSSLAHLRVERVKQLEDALSRVAIELDELSAQVLERVPPKVSITASIRSVAFELGRTVRELLVEVGAFGIVVPVMTSGLYNGATTAKDGGRITAVDIIKALSSTCGVARGPSGAKEREKQAKVMLRQLHARHNAIEKEAAACRREAEYWRSAWETQDGILRQLAKRIRCLGQKKVEWCQRYLMTPMITLTEVMSSFQHENTTRQNPYLPLLIETLSMEQPMLIDALKQWQEYSNSVQLKMDELVVDYEANRLVLASSSTRPKPQPIVSYHELGINRALSSKSEEVSVS